jgi:hypothetical protein
MQEATCLRVNVGREIRGPGRSTTSRHVDDVGNNKLTAGEHSNFPGDCILIHSGVSGVKYQFKDHPRRRKRYYVCTLVATPSLLFDAMYLTWQIVKTLPASCSLK